MLRVIPTEIPELGKLGLPARVRELAEEERGLVLVTGATGSGKSSTLAAMIHHINLTRSTHILTIEDPIEFLHTNVKSRVSQREVGPDTKSFTTALRSSLRQDPDVILVGEMRDPETNLANASFDLETETPPAGTSHRDDIDDGLGSPAEAQDILELVER